MKKMPDRGSYEELLIKIQQNSETKQNNTDRSSPLENAIGKGIGLDSLTE